MAEIERKFLAAKLPKDKIGISRKVRQGYIFPWPIEVRVRQEADEYYFTIKDLGQLKRFEWERKIPKWLFLFLWLFTKGTRIYKQRWVSYHSGWKQDVDLYQGHLKEILVVECEFKTDKEAVEFQVPDWFGTVIEVTEDDRFKNRNLAMTNTMEAHSLMEEYYKALGLAENPVKFHFLARVQVHSRTSPARKSSGCDSQHHSQ